MSIASTASMWLCPLIFKVTWLMLIPKSQRNTTNKLRLCRMRLNSGMPKSISRLSSSPYSFKNVG
jgi:hypothetical protein